MHITKTGLYNFDHLKPHFYIVKLGFTDDKQIGQPFPKKGRHCYPNLTKYILTYLIVKRKTFILKVKHNRI